MPRTYPAHLRQRARDLRKQGLTYSEIAKQLGGIVNVRTVGEWVQDIELTEEQKARIKKVQNEKNGMVRKGRTNTFAGEWNTEQKRLRILAAEQWAEPMANKVVESQDALLMLLAGLWAGEGSKADHVLSFPNSDPRIIQGWLGALRRCFEIEESRLRCKLMISSGMVQEQEQLLAY